MSGLALVPWLCFKTTVPLPLDDIDSMKIQHVAAVICGVMIGLFWKRYRRLCQEQQVEQERREAILWNDTIFFPSNILPETDPKNPITRLQAYFDMAERSIKICVMTVRGRLTKRRLIDFLIQRRRKGIMIQVYTAACPATLRNTQMLEDNGVEVRYKTYAYVTTMHHKFMIIDDRYLISGSLNWSDDALLNQKDNLLVTNDTRIVSRFCNEFERIWNVYDEVDREEI